MTFSCRIKFYKQNKYGPKTICQEGTDNWKLNVQNSPKLRTYCTLKDTYQLEPYIYKIQNRQERSLLAKFCFGILPQQIEIGHWKNIKDGICKICDEGVALYILKKEDFLTDI